MKKSFFLILAILTFATSAFAQLGTVDKDLVFTPLTPCRLFDTRTSQGGTGSIPAAGTKGFAVWGQTSFAGQGGANNNCGLTANSDTAAVAVNITVVLPAAGGYITAYPAGVTAPAAATVNFNAGDIKGNFAIVKVKQTGSAPDLNIFSTTSIDVVGDVVGYYSRPVATALECSRTFGNFVSVPANTYGFGVSATCPVGYTATSLGIEAAANVVMADSSMNSSGGTVFTYNLGSTAQSTRGWVQCCRIPGR